MRGENVAIQYGCDKSAHIALIGYPMNVDAKMTPLTGHNKVSVGNNVCRFFHPSIQAAGCNPIHFKENEWKYANHNNNSLYGVYTT